MAAPATTRDISRSRRKRAVRARSISMKRLPKAALEIGRAMFPETEYWKPRTRAECVEGHRPCPYVSCKHHLYLDVSPQTGAIKLNFPDLEVWELGESCALDIADRGGATLEEVGAIMNITRERIRQVEVKALACIEDEARDGPLHEYANEGDAGKRALTLTPEKGTKQMTAPIELKHPSFTLKMMMKKALLELKVSQGKAANEMGISQGALCQWLNYKGDSNAVSNTSIAVQKWLDEHPLPKSVCATLSAPKALTESLPVNAADEIDVPVSLKRGLVSHPPVDVKPPLIDWNDDIVARREPPPEVLKISPLPAERKQPEHERPGAWEEAFDRLNTITKQVEQSASKVADLLRPHWKRGALADWKLVAIVGHEDAITVTMRNDNGGLITMSGPDNDVVWNRLNGEALRMRGSA